MDAATAAAALNNREYGKEGSHEFFKMLSESRLVAVFGASDDLIEFRGAIHDEVGAYGGGTAYITPRGLFEATCDDDRCPHERLLKAQATTIEALWCPGDDLSWSYRTKIPHHTFRINEDGEPYCDGIVFSLGDVA